MPGVTRVNKDTAGGLITGNLSPKVTVENFPICVNGAQIIPHGTSAHASAIMIASQNKVAANKINVVVAGDSATCGHKSTGSSKVTINGS